MNQDDKLIAWRRTIAHMHGRRRAEGFLGFLAASGTLLSSEIDFYYSLPKLADLAVPFLGDWISIDLFFGNGHVKNVAEKSAIPLTEEHKSRLNRVFKPFSYTENGVVRIALKEKPAFYPPVTDQERAEEPMHILLNGLGVNAFMVVPLALPRGRFGALTVLSLQAENPEDNRTYGPAEMAVCEELGRRISLAIERSILYNEGWRLKKNEITNN